MFFSVYVVFRLKVLNDYVFVMCLIWDLSNLRIIIIVFIFYYVLCSFGVKLYDVWEEVNGSFCYCKKNIVSKYKIIDYFNCMKGVVMLYLLKYFNIWIFVWLVMGIDL